jgi:hypothetical protein
MSIHNIPIDVQLKQLHGKELMPLYQVGSIKLKSICEGLNKIEKRLVVKLVCLTATLKDFHKAVKLGLITDVKQHFEFVETVVDRDISIGDFGYNLVETKRYLALSGALLNEIAITSELQTGFIKTDYPVQNIGFSVRDNGDVVTGSIF